MLATLSTTMPLVPMPSVTDSAERGGKPARDVRRRRCCESLSTVERQGDEKDNLSPVVELKNSSSRSLLAQPGPPPIGEIFAGAPAVEHRTGLNVEP